VSVSPDDITSLLDEETEVLSLFPIANFIVLVIYTNDPIYVQYGILATIISTVLYILLSIDQEPETTMQAFVSLAILISWIGLLAYSSWELRGIFHLKAYFPEILFFCSVSLLTFSILLVVDLLQNLRGN